jgi:hypothetical protein
MADFKEQTIRIKFCFKLKKTVVETHRMLVEAFGEMLSVKIKHFGGTIALRMDERLSTMMSVLDDRRQAQHRHFDTIEEIQAESQEVLKTLTLKDFQGCMESWKTPLGSLYPCPRGLLRRRRWKLILMISISYGQIS